VKDFAIQSDGEKVPNPRTYKKYEDKLAHEQRMLAKKQKGGKRWEAQKLKVGRTYYKMTCVRDDFLHKYSTAITKRYGYIALEDLNVAGMMKNHHLSASIANVSWGKFVGMLKYKCVWYGAVVKQIGRYEPSSKQCHWCGYRKADLTLDIREWDCPECGKHHDRDINAAINILLMSYEIAPPGRGYTVGELLCGRVEESSMDGPGKRENLEEVLPSHGVRTERTRHL
jgi:putative transposase